MANDEDEDQSAAAVLSEILTSAMQRAHDVDKRTWLYGWERDGYRWLIRFWDRRPSGSMCAWSGAFLRLNRDAILSPDGRMDFNLRAAREQAEGHP